MTTSKLTAEDLAAIARVQEFIASHESWEGEDSHISTTGAYGSLDRVSLTSADLKAVMAALDAVTHTD